MHFVYILLILVIAADSQHDQLPQEGECGALNTTHLYNRQTVAELDEFPWTGRIAYRLNENATTAYRCVAVLISRRHLLTNANCFRYEEQPYAVVLGDWNTTNGLNDPDCDGRGDCAPAPSYHDIEEIVIHRNYYPRLYANNIALLKVAKPVTYTRYIRPICLPGKAVSGLDFAFQHLTLAGWHGKNSEEPRKVKIFAHVAGLKGCARLNRLSFSDIFASNSHICAFTCKQDGGFKYFGGSPLMGVATLNADPAHYYLIGMVAYGRANCSKTSPDLFTRIDGHLDWVRENVLD